MSAAASCHGKTADFADQACAKTYTLKIGTVVTGTDLVCLGAAEFKKRVEARRALCHRQLGGGQKAGNLGPV